MTPDNLYTDHELLHLLQQGDERAVDQLYLRYWKPLYYSAYAILKEEAVCQDIIQELFITIWQRRAHISIQTSFKSYLFTAVRNRVFSIIRQSYDERLFEGLGERMSSWTGDGELLLAEIERTIARAVSELPEGCRQVYLLSREQDLSHAEIARQLDISTKTVANQLTKALRHIRTSLGQLFL